jgi:hypothetical protein
MAYSQTKDYLAGGPFPVSHAGAAVVGSKVAHAVEVGAVANYLVDITASLADSVKSTYLSAASSSNEESGPTIRTKA